MFLKKSRRRNESLFDLYKKKKNTIPNRNGLLEEVTQSLDQLIGELVAAKGACATSFQAKTNYIALLNFTLDLQADIEDFKKGALSALQDKPKQKLALPDQAK